MLVDTDYLVVGGGATGLAFVDALTAEADVELTVVDRHRAPGGHWLHAYQFVRLHTPSAYYGREHQARPDHPDHREEQAQLDLNTADE
jgi:cation diffusion facilitator CzcD-associated flavoprotein CzcO